MNDLDFLKHMKISDKQEKVVKELYKKPKERIRDMPHYKSPITDGLTHQVDLLELPMDNKYKYCLTVVDVGNRMIIPRFNRSIGLLSAAYTFHPVFNVGCGKFIPAGIGT